MFPWRVAAVALALLLARPFSLLPLAQGPAAATPVAPWESHPTWSPDSRRIALESNRNGNVDIVIRDLDTSQETVLTSDPADDEEPSWEPAGDCIAFRSGRDGGGIFVQCPNGPARRVAPDGHGPRWSPDGRRLLYTTQADGVPALYVVPRDGGQPVAALAALTSTLVGSLRAVWTSQGRIALIGTHPAHGVGLWVLPDDAREAPAPSAKLSRLLLLMKARNPPAFEIAADGSALYVSGRQIFAPTLFRVPLDARTSAISGGPEPIARWTGEALGAVISPSGARIAAALQTNATRVFVFPFDPASGSVRADAGQAIGPEDARSVFPDLSADGNLLLYTVLRKDGSTELRVWAAPNRTDVALTADGAYRFGPRWSPGGTTLTYRWHGSGNGQAVSAVRMIDLVAKRESVVTTTAPGVGYTPFGWSNDGQHILASALKGSGDTVSLVGLPLSGAPKAERKPRTLAAPAGYKLWQARMSPNGRWIVVNVQPSNDAWSSIAVVPADGGDYRRLTTDDDAWDDKPRWSPDGRTVYFLSRRSGEFELWRIGFDPETGQTTGAATRVTSLTTPRRRVLRDIGVLDLALSPSRLAVPIEETRSALQIGDVPTDPGRPGPHAVHVARAARRRGSARRDRGRRAGVRPHQRATALSGARAAAGDRGHGARRDPRRCRWCCASDVRGREGGPRTRARVARDRAALALRARPARWQAGAVAHHDRPLLQHRPEVTRPRPPPTRPPSRRCIFD